MSRSTIAAAALAALVPLTALTVPTASVASAPDDADAAAAPYKVVARIDKSEVVANDGTVKIRGRVSPKAAGEKVILQQRRGNQRRWRLSGTGRVRESGFFVLKDEPTTGGHRSYRVVKPASDGYAKGVSNEMHVAVWAYELLTSRPAGVNSGVSLGSTTYVATDARSSSVVLTNHGGSGYVEYTLGGECRSLSATNALTDDSATGAVGNLTVSVDGSPRVTHDLTTGDVVPYTIDVTDAFRVRLDLRASASPAGKAVVATPVVLCLD